MNIDNINDYTEIDPFDKIDEVKELLLEKLKSIDSTAQEFKLIQKYDPDEECHSIIVQSCNNDKHVLWIDFDYEISLFFGSWHDHYEGYIKEYKDFKENLVKILNSELGIFSVYSDGKWRSSDLTDKKMMSREETKNYLTGLYDHPEFIKILKANGAETFLEFWDESLNQSFSFEASEF